MGLNNLSLRLLHDARALTNKCRLLEKKEVGAVEVQSLTIPSSISYRQFCPARLKYSWSGMETVQISTGLRQGALGGA